MPGRSVSILGFLALLLVWQLVSLIPLGPLNLLLSSPEKVFRAIPTIPFGSHLAPSITAFLLGFLAAMLTTPFWVLFGRYPRLEQFFSVAIHGLNAAPSLILSIMVLVFFGIGFKARVAAVFLGAVFPMIYHTSAAVRETYEVYKPQIEATKSLGMKNRQIIRHIAVPLALPHIFSGIKQAVGRAFRALIGIEIYVSTVGIGSLAATYYGSFQINRLYAVTIVIIAITNLLIAAVEYLERVALPWRHSKN